MENKNALDQLWAWGGCNPNTFSEWDDREFSKPSRLLPASNQAKRATAFLTALVFAWTMICPLGFAETIKLEGGSVDVDTKDNVTNWNVTGNPVWNVPEFNVAEGSIYNIAGLGSGASLALLVNGGNASNIFGTMNLFNLDFILQNIAGINIGANAAINLNAASLIASTLPLNLTATNFLSHDYQFGDPAMAQNGFLSNAGRITGGAKDFVALISNAIENKGTIEVPMGTVALAAGKTVTVGISGDGMVSIGVDEATANELGLKDQIKNTGTISANGGKVMLTAKAVDGLFDKAINIQKNANAVTAVQADNGTIEFQSMDDIYNDAIIQAMNGQIKMSAGGGNVTNAGKMDVNTGRIDVDAGKTGTMFNYGTLRYKTLTEKGYSFKSGSESRQIASSEGGKAYYENLDGAAYLAGHYGTDQSDIGNLIIDTDQTVTLDGDVTFTADSNNNGNGIFTMNSGSSLVGGGHNLTVYSGQNRSTHSDVDPSDDSAGAEQSIFKTVSGINTLTLNSSNSSDTTYNANLATVGSFSIGTMKTNLHSIFTRSEGSGTSGDPYMIYSISNAAGGIQYIPTLSLSAYYQIANNIDASETSTWNSNGSGGYYGFSSIDTFAGNLNGNSKTVSGLYMNRSDNGVGLFNYLTSTAHIENLGLLNVDIHGSGSMTGSLIGETSDGFIENCYSTGLIRGNGLVGGLIGRASHLGSGVRIERSYSSAEVTGTGIRVGGLIGEVWGEHSSEHSIVDSYATGNVSGSIQVGGLAGYIQEASVSNSYATGNVTGEDSVGGLVGVIDSASITNSFSTGVASSTGDTPGGLIGHYVSGTLTNNWWYNGTNTVGIGTGDLGGVSKANAASDFNGTGSGTGGAVYTGWDRNGLWVSGAGTPHLIWQDMTGGGTSSNPWMITNVNQLQFMSYGLSSYYKLAQDIDASATSTWNSNGSGGFYGFSPIGTYVEGNSGYAFSGNFNGNYKTISDLYINRPNSFLGLFGMASSPAVISNVGLIDVNITGQGYAGGLVGTNWGAITNSYATGNVTGSSYIGGLVGLNHNGVIRSSYAAVNVNGSDGGIGGLVGLSEGDEGLIINSYATGNVNGGFTAGGLIGANWATITNSYATGNVTGGYNVGGLAGYSQGAVTNSYAVGVATGDYQVGGLIGDNWSSVVNSYWYNKTNSAGIGRDNASFFGEAASVTKASSESDFYGTGSGIGGAVYTGTPAWDFTTVLQVVQSLYPLFQWEVNVWTAAESGAWSNAANWSKGVVPTAGSTVLFNGTSTQGSILDNLFSGSVGKLYVDTGYTGTITQNRSLTVSDIYSQGGGTFSQSSDFAVSGNYVQNGGKFIDANPYYTGNETGHTFTVDSSFSVPVYDGGTSYFKRYTGAGTVDDPYLIRDVYDLQAVQGFLGSGTYLQLNNDITASSTANWNSGTGFLSLGNGSTKFAGNFEGNGKTITGLTIDARDTSYAGLFGYTDTGSSIANLTLEDINITAYGAGGVAGVNPGDSGTDGNLTYVGALAGYNKATVTNVHVTGTSSVSGTGGSGGAGAAGNFNYGDTQGQGGNGGNGAVAYVGGLIGYNSAGAVTDSESTGAVIATAGSGGVGGAGESPFTGSGDGGSGSDVYVGGLIGQNAGGTILRSSHTSGNIIGMAGNGGSSNVSETGGNGGIGGAGGSAYVGGLIGDNTGSVTDSNTTGTVTAQAGSGGNGAASNGGWGNNGGSGGVGGNVYAGGLVGQNTQTILRSSHLAGNVVADAGAGGSGGASVYFSGGSGKDGGTAYVGGLIGLNSGNVSDSDTSGAVDINSPENAGLGGSGGSSANWESSDLGGTAGNAGSVYGGGLIGKNTGVIDTSSHLTGNITGKTGQGGAGANGYTGSDGGNGGTIWLAGLIGYNSTGSVTDSNSTGAVNATSGSGSAGGNGDSDHGGTGGSSGSVYVGGLIGQNLDSAAILRSNHDSGDITGTAGNGGNAGDTASGNGVTGGSSGSVFAGGLIGQNIGGTVDDSSHLDGNILGVAGNGEIGGEALEAPAGWGGAGGSVLVGGLIGDNTGNITNSDTTGSVTGNAGMGGVGGYGNNSIDAAGGNGGLAGTAYAGGLIGKNTGSIDGSSHLDGIVTGNAGIGGSGGTSTSGRIGAGSNGGDAYVGGLVGKNTGAVSDSDSTGAVDINSAVNAGYGGSVNASAGTVYGGGLIGKNTAVIDNSSHHSGDVTARSGSGAVGATDNWGANGGSGGTIYLGGLIGDNSTGSVTDSDSSGAVNAISGNGGSGGVGNSYLGDGGDGGLGGSIYIGGLIGRNVNAVVTRSDHLLESGDVTFTSGNGGNGGTATGIGMAGAGGAGGSVWAGELIGSKDGSTVVDSISGAGVTGRSGDGGNSGSDYLSFGVSGGTGGSITISDTTFRASSSVIIGGSGGMGDGGAYNSDGTIRFTGTVNVNGDLTITGNYSQTDGTVNQNADFEVSGGFSLTGGTFVDASPLDHTFTASGSFSVPYASAGTFNRYTGDGSASNPYVIRDLYDLQAMKNHLTSNFTLNSNLDATSVVSWNSNRGFDPIGDLTHAFTGTLQGAGKIISNLKLDRTNTDYIGFFGHIGVGGLVNMMGLENVSSYGYNYVGGLVALNEGTLTNVYTTGSFTVMGVNFVGGLVGSNTGSIANAYSSTRVMGTDKVGGLAGSNTGTIDKTYTMGQVIGTTNTGGLVGSGSGTVTNSFWNANMTGQATSAGGTAGKVIRVTGQVDENGYAIPNPEDVANPDPDMMNSSSYSGWDFGSTWVLDPGGSFPHFQYRFPNGVRGVWGTVYNTEGATQEAGKIVDLYVNTDPLDTTGLGTKVDSTKSNADGMYYFVMGKNDVQATDWVIGKLDGGDGFTGNTRMPAATGSIEGLDIWGTMARNIPHANKYVEPAPVEIPSTNQLQQALEEVNRSLQTILNSISQSESALSTGWSSAADVQIQDETFSVPGLEWLRAQTPATAPKIQIPKTPKTEEKKILETRAQEEIDTSLPTPDEAAISFYEQLTPGREPVPQLNPKAVMFSIAEKIMQPSKGSSVLVNGGTTASQTSGGQSNGQATGLGSSTVKGDTQTVANVVAAAESSLSSDEEADEADLSMDEDLAEDGNVSRDGDQLGKDGSSAEKEASRDDRGRMDFSDYFSVGMAKKLLTDVRVIEGAVYVIDGVHTTSLLIPGESVRVFFKKHKDEERTRIPSYIHPPAEPEPMVLKTDPPVPGVKKDDGMGPVVKKNDKPQATVGANPLMPILKNDESMSFLKDDAAASSVKVDPKSFVLDPAPGASLPPAPKDIVNTTMSLARELVNKGPMYGTLKNPGINVFVKCKGGEWQAARDGMVVLPGDEIRTAANNTVQVLLDNGKVGQVEVKEGSLFRISKAEMDPKTGDKTTLLDLAVGKVLVHAEKLQGGSKFEVKTPTALTGVRGTVFEVTVKEKL